MSRLKKVTALRILEHDDQVYLSVYLYRLINCRRSHTLLKGTGCNNIRAWSGQLSYSEEVHTEGLIIFICRLVERGGIVLLIVLG